MVGLGQKQSLTRENFHWRRGWVSVLRIDSSCTTLFLFTVPQWQSCALWSFIDLLVDLNAIRISVYSFEYCTILRTYVHTNYFCLSNQYPDNCIVFCGIWSWMTPAIYIQPIWSYIWVPKAVLCPNYVIFIGSPEACSLTRITSLTPRSRQRPSHGRSRFILLAEYWSLYSGR